MTSSSVWKRVACRRRPTPNTAHAAWGRRLHRLDVDPVTGPHGQAVQSPHPPDPAPQWVIDHHGHL
jgi:hypothetical protein